MSVNGSKKLELGKHEIPLSIVGIGAEDHTTTTASTVVVG